MCDATGGSQGFAQLVCMMGNYHENAPAPEMIESCCWLLAHLADRYGVDTRAGATTEIISRGSNKWPAGTAVTARTIAGHREMSATLCPGDFVQPLLDREIPERVARYRSVSAAAVAASTTTEPPETAPPETVPAETVAPETVPAETVAPETVASTVSPEAVDEFIEAAPAPVAPEIPSGPVPERVGADAGGSSSPFRTVARVVSVSAAGVAAGATLVQRQQHRRRASEIPTDELLDEVEAGVLVGRTVNGSVGHEDFHATLSTLEFETRGVGNPGREAGNDAIEVVGHQVAAVAVGANPYQRYVGCSRVEPGE
jgi:hypothetical protein